MLWLWGVILGCHHAAGIDEALGINACSPGAADHRVPGSEMSLPPTIAVFKITRQEIGRAHV